MSVLEEVTLQHSEIGRTVYEKRGRLTPKLWVQGVERMMVAEPIDDNAHTATSDEHRVTLLIAMAVKTNALIAGRSDEAFIRVGLPDRLEAGGLRRIADIDPEVRTCVLTEAVMIGGSEDVTIVARHGLDDYGRHLWDVHTSRSSMTETLVPLKVARDLISGGLPDFWHDPIALTQFAEQIRWHVQTFPDPDIE